MKAVQEGKLGNGINSSVNQLESGNQLEHCLHCSPQSGHIKASIVTNLI